MDPGNGLSRKIFNEREMGHDYHDQENSPDDRGPEKKSFLPAPGKIVFHVHGPGFKTLRRTSSRRRELGPAMPMSRRTFNFSLRLNM